jgi:alkaline phosphatase
MIHRCAFLLALFVCLLLSATARADHLRDLQSAAAMTGKAEWGHWGPDSDKYTSWTSHSNRLIPVYTFGMKLDAVAGENSIYRSASRLRELYGYVPRRTVNTDANYFDQTDIYRLQQQAADAGKKRIILFVFDGMDWWTTWAAAIYRAGEVRYSEGRGSGLHFQDYRGAETDFGYMVTSPASGGGNCDVDDQRVVIPGSASLGGYDWRLAGDTPWSRPSDAKYIIGKSGERKHAYTDSASSATSMTSGVKTYNVAVNCDNVGRPVKPISQQLQEKGWAIGVVTSVPISHATPACAYANNVHRDDYQDITRDLLGRPSISHPDEPLPGVDVLLGGGWGQSAKKDSGQGDNFVPGNKCLTDEDRDAIDVKNGGRYIVVQRTKGKDGRELLADGVKRAIDEDHRLFGYFGGEGGHLPFRTADGKFDPTYHVTLNKLDVPGPAEGEKYKSAARKENPLLSDFATAALDVLADRDKPFWLLIESGDVDWANHSNNIDNSVGAVISGDDAFRAITDWIERHGGWSDTALILTADHGHYLVIDKPEMLAGPKPLAANTAAQ